MAVSPTVDTKKTAVGANVTQEVLQSLPTARDPWVILQMAPAIIIDRENVGGAESEKLKGEFRDLRSLAYSVKRQGRRLILTGIRDECRMIVCGC